MGQKLIKPKKGNIDTPTPENGITSLDDNFFDKPEPEKWEASAEPVEGRMTPEERKSLRRCKEDIIRTIDVNKVLDIMFHKGALSVEDEDKIINDPRRRQRIAVFLGLLEEKSSETFQVFVEALAEHYPHIYLKLTDWEEDDLGYQGGANDVDMLNHDKDEWSQVRFYRDYLVKELNCDKILALIEEKEILGEMELRQIRSVKNRQRRCETFLEIIETKESLAYEVFLDAVSQLHPNIYLILTGNKEEDEDDILGDL